MIDKAKYSKEICMSSRIFVIDNVCVKCRGEVLKNVTPAYIKAAKETHDNIGIQTGDKIEIYCDQNYEARMKSFMDNFDSTGIVKQAYQAGKIKFYIK